MVYSKHVFHSTCSFCLCHLYPTPSRNSFVFLFVFFFFVALFSRMAFCFVVLSYPVRSHLMYLPRFFSVWFFYVSLSEHRVCMSLGWRIKEGHRGYCWCRWVERTCWFEDNNMVRMKNEGRAPGVLLMSLGRKNMLIWRQHGSTKK